jgi:Zn-dependent oligopeptidase
MGLAKTIEKLQTYYQRLEAGKAKKIKPGHVERVIEKLIAKEHELLEEIAGTSKPSKTERLEKKLTSTREQLDRAKWLLNKIS